MIDVAWVAANALWVFGLAWVVAALGWRDAGRVRWGLVLTGLGLCAARSFLPERVLWALLTLAIPVQAAVQRRRRDEEGE